MYEKLVSELEQGDIVIDEKTGALKRVVYVSRNVKGFRLIGFENKHWMQTKDDASVQIYVED